MDESPCEPGSARKKAGNREGDQDLSIFCCRVDQKRASRLQGCIQNVWRHNRLPVVFIRGMTEVDFTESFIVSNPNPPKPLEARTIFHASVFESPVKG